MIFRRLFPKKKPVEEIVAENNQKVYDIKEQSAVESLTFEREVRQLHQKITAYKVALATGRI